MKQILKIFIVSLITIVSACASGETAMRQDCDDDSCAQPTRAMAASVPAVAVYQNNGVACPATEYTVRRPVEVVYQNITYRTVYVPQTTQSVSYERRPYVAGELCGNGDCLYR